MDISKGDKLGVWIFQKETGSFWESGKQNDRFGILGGLFFENGVMAGGVLAQNNFGARCRIEAETLRGDGNSAIGADLDGSANAPDEGPPRAARHGPQDGAFFLLCQIPCLERFHLQLPMDFMRIVMLA